MFSRFSPAARGLIRAAEQESRNHNHYYVGAEHLLEALLSSHDPSITAALRAQHVDVGEVHADVRRSMGVGDDRIWEGILVTPRLRKLIALAEERAGEAEVQPIDLFEALRAEGGSLAAEILRRATRNVTPVSE